MIYNIDFNLCAILLYGILLFCYYYKKTISNTSNRIFLHLAYLGLATTILDTLGQIFSVQKQIYASEMSFVCMLLYRMGLCLISFVYYLYTLALTDTIFLVFRKRRQRLLLLPAPCSMLFILLYGFLNWSDSHHPQWMQSHTLTQLALVVSVFYMVLALAQIIRNRRMLLSQKKIALFFFILLSVFATVVQLLYPDVVLLMLGIAACILLIFLTLQNPEQVLDSVTGLYNADAFFNIAGRQFGSGAPFHIISIMINHYQYLNRTLGYSYMRQIMADIARALEKLPIAERTIFYTGDGHFILVIAESSMFTDTPQSIAHLFDTSWLEKENGITLSAHICVADCPGEIDSMDTLSECYQICSDEADLHDQTQISRPPIVCGQKNRKNYIENSLIAALEEERFEVYFQPIYSVKQDRITSAEVLLRLHDNDLGFISPAEFIPIAEKTGDIITISIFVFRKVCEFIQNHDLKQLGIESVEINLSFAQCMQKNLASQFLDILKEYQVPPNQIILEITESVASYSPESLDFNMRILKDAGIRFSLDDYGTGFTSLSNLIALPYDQVKLDKKLVSVIHLPKGRIAVSSAVAMFRKLDKAMVAEGVETQAQKDYLSLIGCDYLQGFYFSSPVCLRDFLDMLRNTRESIV